MFALAIALSLIALLILLPLTTSARVLRLHRELEELRERVAALEAAAARAAAGVPRVPEVPGVPGVTQVPGVPAVPPVREVPPVAAAAEAEDDLEEKIGGRWLLYTGVLVLLFGVSFFLKYAFDNEWINETGRVVIGAIAGLGLIAGGSRLSTRGFAVFGQALAGTGLAVLYLAIYAAHTYYELINQTIAFGLMVLVTLGAAALADRWRAQALAVIAVGGGFLTPFLVGGDRDAQLTLFTYDALLIAGTMMLARRHNWFWLNALSYGLTVVTVLAWTSTYYRERVWLRTLLFLTLYCVMFIQIMRDTRRVATPLARFVVLLLATAPVLYHIAAVLITSAHPPAIHIYLIAFTAVGLLFTSEPHRPGVRLALLFATYLPLFGSLTLPDGLSWTLANVITIVAVAALHLLAPLDRALRQELELEPSEIVAMQAAAIGLYGLLHEALARSYPNLRGGLAAGLALGAIALWQFASPRHRVAALSSCAIAFTLAAIAIGVQFDGPAAVIGWAAEGAAATWIGLRLSSVAFHSGGLALWAFALVKLLDDDFFLTPAGFTAVFNTRTLGTAAVVVLGYVIAWMFAKYRDTLDGTGRVRALLHVACSFATMAWITAEVQSYWAVRYATPQADLYEQLGLSLAWGLYGALLIIVGMRRAYAPDRYIGMAVLAITILKVFFYDLWALGGIYRVIGFITFGVLLLAVSYLYQKRRATPPAAPPAESTPREREPRVDEHATASGSETGDQLPGQTP